MVTEVGAILDDALPGEDSQTEQFLEAIRSRIQRAGVEMPTVEARFDGLQVEAPVFNGSKAMPSVSRRLLEYLQMPLQLVGVKFGDQTTTPILRQLSGILKPGRFTLLLGPPGSGKSTLLKALSGKLEKNLTVKGDVTLNGHTIDEFVIQRTSAYVEQQDVHIAELTVRETLDFAARVQGVGHRGQVLDEVKQFEASKRVTADPKINKFMEAEATSGKRQSVATQLVMRLIGLDYVANTLIGGEMVRGISGGQKKRVTTAEMLVGPCKTLMMDEISTGLDSSTTFQITRILASFAHVLEATLLVALLQPAPEVYDQFDDILLLSEGSLIFHGPREEVLPFFQLMGFQLPERKGIADFLQEVTSRKDQAQYWHSNEPYHFVSVAEFAEAFQHTEAATRTREAMSMPYDRSACPQGSLRQEKYGLKRLELLRALLQREWVLIKRHSFIYLFRFGQVIMNALLAGTLFLRTTRSPDSLNEANYYLGVLFFSLSSMLFNSWAEFELIVERLPVFFRQRGEKLLALSLILALLLAFPNR